MTPYLILFVDDCRPSAALLAFAAAVTREIALGVSFCDPQIADLPVDVTKLEVVMSPPPFVLTDTSSEVEEMAVPAPPISRRKHWQKHDKLPFWAEIGRRRRRR